MDSTLVQHRIYSQVCKIVGVEEKSERLIIITFDDSFSSDLPISVFDNLMTGNIMSTFTKKKVLRRKETSP